MFSRLDLICGNARPIAREDYDHNAEVEAEGHLERQGPQAFETVCRSASELSQH